MEVAAHRAIANIRREHRRERHDGVEPSPTPSLSEMVVDLASIPSSIMDGTHHILPDTVAHPETGPLPETDAWWGQPALPATDWDLVSRFHRALGAEEIQVSQRCSRRWLHLRLDHKNVCANCVLQDSRRQPEGPFLFSAENFADPGELPTGLPALTQVEEMLIARVYVFIEVRQYKGVQYSYKGHIVNFLASTGKIYNQLPLLPGDLDIILLKPANAKDLPQLPGDSCIRHHHT